MPRHYGMGHRRMHGGFLPAAPGGPREANRMGALMGLLKKAGNFLAKSGVLSRLFRKGAGRAHVSGLLGYKKRMYRRHHAGRRRHRGPHRFVALRQPKIMY
jgi:hypothetical protein